MDARAAPDTWLGHPNTVLEKVVSVQQPDQVFFWVHGSQNFVACYALVKLACNLSKSYFAANEFVKVSAGGFATQAADANCLDSSRVFKTVGQLLCLFRCVMRRVANAKNLTVANVPKRSLGIPNLGDAQANILNNATCFAKIYLVANSVLIFKNNK